MAKSPQHNARQKAIEQLRKHNATDVVTLSEKLISGDRSALSQAITLIESTNEQHKNLAAQILNNCLPHSGNSLRIGITGVPGVGKSTFIEALGQVLLYDGKKVAVLAIDPSSSVSKGSILGDKTRMEWLSQQSNAFIRPSPSALTLGGVARKTRESIVLCEAAGFNVILIETVGVGQSETAVHGMTDFFLLLMLAGAGDQLQGIKRGIIEMCDGMLITKADGANSKNAQRAGAEYLSALHLFPPTTTGWVPKVLTCSAIEKTGIEDAWRMIVQHETWMKERQLFEAKRMQQDEEWLHAAIQENLTQSFFSNLENKEKIAQAEQLVHEKKLTPFAAANWVLSLQ
jgi:LAO/AO transport system kinase